MLFLEDERLSNTLQIKQTLLKSLIMRNLHLLLYRRNTSKLWYRFISFSYDLWHLSSRWLLQCLVLLNFMCLYYKVWRLFHVPTMYCIYEIIIQITVFKMLSHWWFLIASIIIVATFLILFASFAYQRTVDIDFLKFDDWACIVVFKVLSGISILSDDVGAWVHWVWIWFRKMKFLEFKFMIVITNS